MRFKVRWINIKQPLFVLLCHFLLLVLTPASSDALEALDADTVLALRNRKAQHAYAIAPVKMPYAVIYIHGLFADRRVFKWTLDHRNRKDFAFRSHHFFLNLPGHGYGHLEPSPQSVRYQIWQEELHQQVLLAKKMAQKVILVGHSAGGSLALSEAVQHPELVAGLFLIEPAFKVRDVLDYGACLFKDIVKDAKELEPIPTLIGYSTEHTRTVSLIMACEVQKITATLFPNLITPEPGSSSWQPIAKKLKNLRVGIYNNPTDFIVDPEVTKDLFETLRIQNPHSQYFVHTRPVSHGGIEPEVKSTLLQWLNHWSDDSLEPELRGQLEKAARGLNFFNDYVLAKKLLEERTFRSSPNMPTGIEYLRLTMNYYPEWLSDLESAFSICEGHLQNTVFCSQRTLFKELYPSILSNKKELDVLFLEIKEQSRKAFLKLKKVEPKKTHFLSSSYLQTLQNLSPARLRKIETTLENVYEGAIELRCVQSSSILDCFSQVDGDGALSPSLEKFLESLDHRNDLATQDSLTHDNFCVNSYFTCVAN